MRAGFGGQRGLGPVMNIQKAIERRVDGLLVTGDTTARLWNNGWADLK